MGHYSFKFCMDFIAQSYSIISEHSKVHLLYLILSVLGSGMLKM